MCRDGNEKREAVEKKKQSDNALRFCLQEGIPYPPAAYLKGSSWTRRLCPFSVLAPLTSASDVQGRGAASRSAGACLVIKIGRIGQLRPAWRWSESRAKKEALRSAWWQFSPTKRALNQTENMPYDCRDCTGMQSGRACKVDGPGRQSQSSRKAVI